MLVAMLAFYLAGLYIERNDVLCFYTRDLLLHVISLEVKHRYLMPNMVALRLTSQSFVFGT